MRELIRPTLFLMARLGLLFSATVWIVGQWWNVEATASLRGRSVRGFIAAGGVVTLVVQGDHGWRYETILKDASAWEPQFSEPRYFTPDFIAEVRQAPGSFAGTAVPGVVVVSLPVGQFGITVRHWFVVTIFALFYGVLMWVYRKQGKELVADA